MPAKAAASEPLPYRLQTGDQLDIRFFYNTELDQKAVVRPDGKITLQLIGDQRAAGLTPAELKDRLRQRFKGILRRPEISVIVTAFSPPKAYIAGEVEQPGELELGARTQVLQAIIRRGGFTPDAEPRNIVLIRNRGDAPPEFLTLDLAAFLRHDERANREGRIARNLALRPFDIVYVPRTRIASVAEFFDRYIGRILPIYRNMGLSFTYSLQPATEVRVRGQ